MLKDEVRASQGWNAAHTAGYQDLEPGVPLVTNILFQMADQLWNLTGLGSIFQPSDLLSFITGLPILGGVIPGLHTSKITSGTFSAPFLQPLIDSISQGYGGSTGLGFTGLQSFLSGLPDAQNVLDQIVNALGVAGTGHTLTDLFNALIAIPGGNIGSALSASVIPGLHTSKITSGIFGTGFIPDLDAAKITTGTFAQTRVTDLVTDLAARLTSSSALNADNLLSGTLPITRIANNAITNALLATSGIDASKLTAGTLPVAQVPDLPASKTTTGSFAEGRIPNVTKAMSTDMQSVIDNLYQAVNGGSTTNNTTASVKTSVQTMNDQLTNSLVGAGTLFSGTTAAQSRTSMDAIYTETVANTQQIQALQTTAASKSLSGVDIHVNFGDYANGSIPSNFTVTYSGSGTSTVGISSGAVAWTAVNDANRDAFLIYNVEPSNTNVQTIRVTLSGYPQEGGTGGTPYIYLLGRVDSPSSPANYVWCRAYCTGFSSYKADLGCTVSGTDTVWLSNVSLAASMDFRFDVGVGTTERRYRVFSGSQLKIDHTEVGTASQLGSGFRHAGIKDTIRTDSGGTPKHPGKPVAFSLVDGTTPTLVGSGGRMVRTSTTTYNMSPAGTTDFPASWFDTVSANTADITPTLSTNRWTVDYPGWYMVTIGVETTTQNTGGALSLGIKKNGTLYQMGGGSQRAYPGQAASFIIYLETGDYIHPCWTNTDISNWTVRGQADGNRTYFCIALINRSLA